MAKILVYWQININLSSYCINWASRLQNNGCCSAQKHLRKKEKFSIIFHRKLWCIVNRSLAPTVQACTEKQLEKLLTQSYSYFANQLFYRKLSISRQNFGMSGIETLGGKNGKFVLKRKDRALLAMENQPFLSS